MRLNVNERSRCDSRNPVLRTSRRSRRSLPVTIDRSIVSRSSKTARIRPVTVIQRPCRNSSSSSEEDVCQRSVATNAECIILTNSLACATGRHALLRVVIYRFFPLPSFPLPSSLESRRYATRWSANVRTLVSAFSFD